MRQCRAIDALTSLLAENILPLSIVESASFRKYCHSLDPRFVVPSSTHLSTSLLTNTDEAIKSKLTDTLAKAEGVSSNEMVFVHHMPFYSELVDIFNIFQAYNIEGKVITTVRNNASNLVGAFSIPGDLQDYDEDDEEEK